MNVLDAMIYLCGNPAINKSLFTAVEQMALEPIKSGVIVAQSAGPVAKFSWHNLPIWSINEISKWVLINANNLTLYICSEQTCIYFNTIDAIGYFWITA